MEDDNGAPDSWELADLDESLNRLTVSSSSSSNRSPPSSLVETDSIKTNGGLSEDAINQIDEFLREALQNPRERLSVLRIEQDVEKFIRDPSQQKLEFQQLPTSYLRLAAHRIAQHYHLQSTVFLENNIPDGPGSRIVVLKTSECRFPPIRLADIPINSSQKNNDSAVKVAIKQRPRKHSQTGNKANSSKSNHAKTVEERKEEYNRARARIFSCENVNGAANRKADDGRKVHPNLSSSVEPTRVDERLTLDRSESFSGGISESSTGSSRSSRDRTENEPAGGHRTNNKVAIFRDREVDRKDPDYDRSYDRYMQRFDPGFGFSGGPYTIQPIYSPVVNYNTEFPQLGVARRPQLSIDPQTGHMPQHLGASWSVSSPTPAEMGYGPPDTMPPPSNVNHVGATSNSAMYLPSSHYPCPSPGMQYINDYEQIHSPYTQSHQHQYEAKYGLARPR